MLKIIYIFFTLFLAVTTNFYAQDYDTVKSTSSYDTNTTTNYNYFNKLNIRIDTIDNKNENLEERIKELEEPSFVRISLGFGVNAYFYPFHKYIVKPDSNVMVNEYAKSKATGIVSALVTFKLSKKFNLHINIPLTEIDLSVDKAIKLFNKEISLGIGASYNIRERLSLGFIINFIPVDVPDDYVISHKKFTQTTYTEINVTDIPTQHKTYIVPGIYLIYSF